MIPGFPPGSIRFDDRGRASLTDMHRIAGGEGRNQPCKWLANASILEKLKSEFEAIPGSLDCPDDGGPVRVVRGGNAAGTWAVPSLARLYAVHLAPPFHPWREWPDLFASGRLDAPKYWPKWGVSQAQ